MKWKQNTTGNITVKRNQQDDDISDTKKARTTPDDLYVSAVVEETMDKIIERMSTKRETNDGKHQQET
ncbi:unnamed protein product [Allacma fusca]|uniref:Uncharacterized protein n=1 Tax=Allacma fusca TaxID=39272 RepID=A0A8J2KZI1_9HEXA|nr:unnamed protein product [Allacma fusca]